MDTSSTNQQTLSLSSRKRFEADGVKNILTFNDDYVELDTNLGILTLEGEGMRVEELSKDKTKILIIGNISGLFYRETKAVKRFLGKNKK